MSGVIPFFGGPFIISFIFDSSRQVVFIPSDNRAFTYLMHHVAGMVVPNNKIFTVAGGCGILFLTLSRFLCRRLISWVPSLLRLSAPSERFHFEKCKTKIWCICAKILNFANDYCNTRSARYCWQKEGGVCRVGVHNSTDTIDTVSISFGIVGYHTLFRYGYLVLSQE